MKNNKLQLSYLIKTSNIIKCNSNPPTIDESVDCTITNKELKEYFNKHGIEFIYLLNPNRIKDKNVRQNVFQILKLYSEIAKKIGD
jgi:hypothetical protein